MKRVLFSVLTFGCVAFTALAGTAMAGEPQDFHCHGMGLFSPTNIGTDLGGNAGIVIGDGSGSSEYTGNGEDFTIGAQPVGGNGVDEHEGEVITRTTGIHKKGQGIVRWPGKSGVNHVLSSDEGEIEFQYTFFSAHLQTHFFEFPAAGNFSPAVLRWLDVEQLHELDLQ